MTEIAKSIQLDFAVTGSPRIRLRIADESSEAVGWFRPGGFVRFAVRLQFGNRWFAESSPTYILYAQRTSAVNNSTYWLLIFDAGGGSPLGPQEKRA